MTARLAASCLAATLALAAAVASAPSLALGSAADRILGTTASETLRGGDGDDEISAHRGADRVFGGRGDDRVDGGPGRDRIAAGAGDDVVLARDGARDRVHCGPGADRAVVDRGDVVAAGCERILRPPHAGAPMPMGALASVPMTPAGGDLTPGAAPSVAAGWIRGADLVVCVAVAAAPGEPVVIRVDAPGGSVEGTVPAGPGGMLLAGITVEDGGAVTGPVAVEVLVAGQRVQAPASLAGPRGGIDCTSVAGDLAGEPEPLPAGEDPPAG